MKSRTFYEILELSPSTSSVAIHEQFHKLAIIHHPDRIVIHEKGERRLKMHREATDRFAEITEAYTVLRDPASRRKYDSQLAILGKNCESCKGAGTVKVSRGFRANSAVAKVCTSCHGTGKAS